MKHKIPLGTKVSFKGDQHVYEVVEYQDVHICGDDCPYEHDSHFIEPQICVRKSYTQLLPLPSIEWIYDPESSMGRRPTSDELEVV